MTLPDGAAYQVAVLPEGIDGQGFAVTPLFPPDERLRQLQPGCALTLSGRLDGAPVQIAAALRGVHVRGKDCRLQLDAPNAVQHDERRATPRFAVPLDGAHTVAVVHLPGEVLLCRVLDVSRGGARLRLDSADVDIGDLQVLYCEIRRGEQLVQLKVELRWAAVRDGHQELGVRFLCADRATAGRVDQLVADIERYWLQQRRRA